MKLELICSNCDKKISLHLSEMEYEHFLKTGSLIEGSEAYYDLFSGYGWVLKQTPFCDICKYDCSEVYF